MSRAPDVQPQPPTPGTYRRWWREDGIWHQRMMVVRHGRVLDLRLCRERDLAWFEGLDGEWEWIAPAREPIDGAEEVE